MARCEDYCHGAAPHLTGISQVWRKAPAVDGNLPPTVEGRENTRTVINA